MNNPSSFEKIIEVDQGFDLADLFFNSNKNLTIILQALSRDLTIDELYALNDIMNVELNSSSFLEFPFYSNFLSSFQEQYQILDVKSAIGLSISIYRQLWLKLLRTNNSTTLLFTDQTYLIDMTNEIYLWSTSNLINEYIEDLILSELETGVTVQVLLFIIFLLALVGSHLYLYFVLRVKLEYELKSGINVVRSLPCKLRNYLIEVTIKSCPTANQVVSQKAS